MVPQQPVINNVIAMVVLQEFPAMALQCAVTNKQIHEAFNWGEGGRKLPPLNKILPKLQRRGVYRKSYLLSISQ